MSWNVIDYPPDVVCRGDGGLAAGHLPQGHHVVRGQALVAGTNAVDSSHLVILSFKYLHIFTKRHWPWMSRQWRGPGRWHCSWSRRSGWWPPGGGSSLSPRPPWCGWCSGWSRRSGHAGAATRRAPHSSSQTSWWAACLECWGRLKCAQCYKETMMESCKLESFLIKLNASQTFLRTYELNHFMLTENLKRISSRWNWKECW